METNFKRILLILTGYTAVVLVLNEYLGQLYKFEAETQTILAMFLAAVATQVIITGVRFAKKLG